MWRNGYYDLSDKALAQRDIERALLDPGTVQLIGTFARTIACAIQDRRDRPTAISCLSPVGSMRQR